MLSQLAESAKLQKPPQTLHENDRIGCILAKVAGRAKDLDVIDVVATAARQRSYMVGVVFVEQRAVANSATALLLFQQRQYFIFCMEAFRTIFTRPVKPRVGVVLFSVSIESIARKLIVFISIVFAPFLGLTNLFKTVLLIFLAVYLFGKLKVSQPPLLRSLCFFLSIALSPILFLLSNAFFIGRTPNAHVFGFGGLHG